MKVKTALISVSDKTGLDEFARALHGLEIKIISTGGTSKSIRALGIPVTEVSRYTGASEALDGRVKTIHPKIHAGILALRERPSHMQWLKKEGILPIDMVVVNLYPFEKVISRPGAKFKDATTNIDIGGPAMIRSAAKNFISVAAISSPAQYNKVIKELRENNCELRASTLRALAEEVFSKTSQYDDVIAEYLSEVRSEKWEVGSKRRDIGLPERMNISLEKVRDLRYGENPHQRAAFYQDTQGIKCALASAKQLQGKELSFNNILDLDVALEVITSFKEPASCIIKHNNPCGVATASTLEQAFQDAFDSDPDSAFGGIMGFNRRITKKMAQLILARCSFIECIISPGHEKEALKVFSKKKNLRLLELPSRFNQRSSSKGLDFKRIPGGVLVQDWDEAIFSRKLIKYVTKQKPTKPLLDSLLFGWKVAKFVKSNAIVLCKGTKTVGIGAGQMSRVDSVAIAIQKAGIRSRDAVLASDGFFPKTDSIEKAHKAGVAAIIQPGGSIRDKEIISACDKYNIAMVFTGIRHFRH